MPKRPGGEPVVVISHAYWQTRFGGAATALGQTVRVNDRQLTIIGVTPERFQGTVLGLTFDLWMPATLAPVLLAGSRELDDRTMRGYMVLGRLQPRVSLAQAQTELDQAMRELAQLYPDTNAKVQGEVRPFWQATRGPQRMLAGAVMLMQGIMLLLLLAVCGNTANLVLARASARHREMGMRLALGAGPWRVVSLLLDGESAAGDVRRRARCGDRRLGDGRAARGADHRRVSDQVSDEPGRGQPRLCDAARRRVRPGVRHRTGLAAIQRRSAGRASVGSRGRPDAA